jgi:two-component system, OmpR family, phosphate regulon sensor histidine kinase PhoR
VFKDKRSVYIIAFSLLGLLSMQGMWLFYAIKQEKRFLETNTRQAAIESVSGIEQKEDSKLLITSLDTLMRIDDPEKEFDFKSAFPQKHKSEVKVIVNNGQKNVFVHNSDKDHVTTAYSISSDGNEQSEIRIVKSVTEETSGNTKKIKNKLRNYEQLLKKIVYQSQPKNLKIEDRVNFNELTESLGNNLGTRGIDIKPEVAITDKTGKIVFKTPGYVPAATIIIPMFTKDIIAQGYKFNVFYPSTMNYIFKKAIGVIVLSGCMTILLIAVILFLYRKMLTGQKLNQYKNDFINNLTHELKTPLATISLANSNISSAANYSSQDNIKQYTGIIDEESKKLNNHIEKVFELSLLEKEKQIFTPEILNLHEIVSESIVQNRSTISSKNAKVHLLFEAKEFHVKVDGFHFMNVLSNLIDNAIKYNDGHIEINISTKNTGDKVFLSVKDNGIGISKEHQRFVFDKFFRVTDKDLHSTKGFGIGLSYVKQTIELFGGTIIVNSELNKGSEFIISLPYAKS